MTTNQTIDGVPRERLEDAARAARIAGYTGLAEELRALLDSSITDNGDKPDEERSEVLKDMLNFFEAAHARWISGGNSNFCLAALEEMYDAGYRKKLAAQPQGEPVAWMSRCLATGQCEQVSGPEEVNNLEYWSPAFPVYAEQPVPVAVPRLEMAHVVRAHMEIPGCPVLTSNQCHALAMKLNESLKPSL